MTLTTRPKIDDKHVLKLLKENYSLEGKLKDLPSYADLNFKLITHAGDQWVVKIANISQSKQELDFENQVMNLLNDSSQVQVGVAGLKHSKDGRSQMVEVTDSHDRKCTMRVIGFLPGDLWANSNVNTMLIASLGRALGAVDKVLEGFDHPASNRYLVWDIKHVTSIISYHLSSVTKEGQRAKIQSVLDDYCMNIVPSLHHLPTQVIHNDANDYNILVEKDTDSVSGLLDFGDMVNTYRIAELAIASAYAIMGSLNPADVILAIVRAYHEVNPLAELELEVLPDMIRARLAMSLCMSSHQYSKEPDNDYLLISQKGAWRALDAMSSIDKVELVLKLKNKCEFNGQTNDDNESIIQYRKTHLSENLSLAYLEPLKIVAGKKAYLYSEWGKRYLDMVNNVCHVGHCHPKVVAAGQQQMAVLNTNTRYLHDNIVQFSKKLLATMPEQLSVCMFVNSGSEANELALRLARKFTGRRSMVVVEGAYHGNTNTCIDISPYKFDGPGGEGSPNWVKQAIVPDPYRGKYTGRTEAVGKQYALDVKRVIEEFEAERNPVCGFMCESIQGVGGQIVHPPMYLKDAYKYIRQAGGVCIADEVQVGMGRVGSHWWAFQTQDVIPDIITIGKPLGNGHPLAAVVTTKTIADAFVTGMEYFNTFGGNPVSCAIGSAVLDVVQEENLLQHAADVGGYLIDGLKQLQNEFAIIGDVRGVGMFIGAEFVKDRGTLEPAVDQIDYIIERLKDEGILLTTEGPYHNVLKVKPPLAFSRKDAQYFLETLKSILKEERASI